MAGRESDPESFLSLNGPIRMSPVRAWRETPKGSPLWAFFYVSNGSLHPGYCDRVISALCLISINVFF